MLGCSKGQVAQAMERSLPAPYADARFVGIVHFERGRRARPMEEHYGEGRSGRYRQDLERLTKETLISPNERFYIRSYCPDSIDFSRPWKIPVTGEVREPVEIGLSDILSRAEPMGVHLLECSGNGSSFGLLSAATWTGVPLLQLLEEKKVEGLTSRILVSGHDDHSSDQPMQAPEFGASWVYTLDQLAERGAFLATEMNGVELPRHHGYPVRLVMPGWYGCTCIKWVNEIRFVDETEPATAHMIEYASRTEQEDKHELAVDYAAAAIDLSAMPVRIERWDQPSTGPIYRVHGVIWGGNQLTDNLVIRFGQDGEYTPVESLAHETNATWSLWSHMWKPERAGRYEIQLQVEDQGILTRRLDRGYYRRSVQIEAV